MRNEHHKSRFSDDRVVDPATTNSKIVKEEMHQFFAFEISSSQQQMKVKIAVSLMEVKEVGGGVSVRLY